MTAETPAQGILRVNDWGSSKMYQAVCHCGDLDHNHTIDIEADDSDVSVTIYTNTKTNFWSKDRWSHIFKLLFTGYISGESTIILSKQAALNYANVLQSAIRDVEIFREKQNVKIKSK
jgi:hypothetical protein